MAFDLRNGYDLSDPETRRLVWEHLERDRPWLIVGSPPCSAFSTLTSLSQDTDALRASVARGLEHLKFCEVLYRIQMENGMYFLHEHPAGAKSWQSEELRRFLEDPRVIKVNGNMCAFGMYQEDEKGRALLKKNIGLPTPEPRPYPPTPRGSRAPGAARSRARGRPAARRRRRR